MTTMKTYEGNFEKKDGTIRKMRFVKLNEAPQGFLPSYKGEDAAPKKYEEGTELVWDLDKNGFRLFNNKAVVGIIVEAEVEV